MPGGGQARAGHYEVTGVVDVIGSVQLQTAPTQSLIHRYLNTDPEVAAVLQQHAGTEYEIVVDYKGMRRPAATSPAWQHFYWQVLTYAWLRAQQIGTAPVAAGIVVFVNELVPSGEDIEELQDDIQKQATDIMPTGTDLHVVRNWRPGQSVPALSSSFLEHRSIRVIAVDNQAIGRSLAEFDAVVEDIERSVLGEMAGQGVVGAWRSRVSGNPYIAPEKRTCTVCDFKHYCPLAPRVNEGGPPSPP
jgi:hypothetical protein